MVFGIYSNLQRDIKGVNALALAEYLTSISVKYLMVSNFDEDFTLEGLSFKEVCKGCDVLVVFGGDGTVIGVTRDSVEYNLPIIGINIGNLGFLTEAEVCEMKWAIDKIINNEFKIEERNLIVATCNGKVYEAVNDICLLRGEIQHTIQINIFIDNMIADIVRGDGVLVSTPTGSTAYSLSCGGPILSPNIDCLVVTAVCPHSLHSRPMVISNDSKVVLQAIGHGMKLNVDGGSILLDDKNNSVTITKSNFKARFIRIKEENFYNKLLKKLNGWNETKKREIEICQEDLDN